MTKNVEAIIEATLHSVDDQGVVRMKARYETDIDDVWSALTDPQRLARWYGKVKGDLRAGGEFTAFVSGSEWDGQGRIDVCDPPRQLRVTVWEEEGPEEIFTVELVADGEYTTLAVEVHGIPLDLLYAYGAGEQTHLEDLAAHLSGQEGVDWPATWGTRWDELAPSYREMTVAPLER